MRRLSVYLWAAVFCSLSNGASAQPVPADVEALREAKRQATDTFLDSSRPKAERLAALANLGYPEDETFAELLRIGTDPSEDDEIRLAALKRARYDERYVDAVLAIIADTEEGEMLAAGLIEDITRRTTFRQPAELRQRLQGALRLRLNDLRAAVRLAAYRALIAGHDQVAIDQLVESLRIGRDVPVPLPDAIELLDVDGSAKHIVTLRPYLNHRDAAVQAQAARALAVDPESRQTIVGLALNRQTPMVVRLNALRALSREDERFLDYAIRLMSNPDEAADIRYMAMKASVARLNYHHVPAETQIGFAQAVERLASVQRVVTTDGRDVGAQAKKLIPYLRKAFPAMRKHFDRPR